MGIREDVVRFFQQEAVGDIMSPIVDTKVLLEFMLPPGDKEAVDIVVRYLKKELPTVLEDFRKKLELIKRERSQHQILNLLQSAHVDALFRLKKLFQEITQARNLQIANPPVKSLIDDAMNAVRTWMEQLEDRKDDIASYLSHFKELEQEISQTVAEANRDAAKGFNDSVYQLKFLRDRFNEFVRDAKMGNFD